MYTILRLHISGRILFESSVRPVYVQMDQILSMDALQFEVDSAIWPNLLYNLEYCFLNEMFKQLTTAYLLAHFSSTDKQKIEWMMTILILI